MPSLFRSLLALAVSVLAVLLVLEIVLRFLPVNSGLRTEPVDAEHPILHFTPDRDVTWSRFPDFSMRNQAHVNNYGFVSGQDYDPADPRPLVAVIGDSYVEAAMVPWGETLQGRLAEALKPGIRVYSFGASGAPLSQYLAYADWAARTFAPQRMAFVVVGNDFDESLLKYKQDPGFHYFVPSQDGSGDGPGLELVRQDYEPGLFARLMRHSSLARYLVFHLHAPEVARGLFAGGKGTDGGEYVGQTSTRADPQRLADSKAAVDAFLARLPEAAQLAPGQMLFLVDGLRPDLYEPERLESANNSYAGQMRAYFMEKARGQGYLVQDLQPRFMADYAAQGAPFEYPRDAHWNGLGHRVAYQALMDSGLLDGLLPK